MKQPVGGRLRIGCHATIIRRHHHLQPEQQQTAYQLCRVLQVLNFAAMSCTRAVDRRRRTGTRPERGQGQGAWPTSRPGAAPNPTSAWVAVAVHGAGAGQPDLSIAVVDLKATQQKMRNA